MLYGGTFYLNSPFTVCFSTVKQQGMLVKRLALHINVTYSTAL